MLGEVLFMVFVADNGVRVAAIFAEGPPAKKAGVLEACGCEVVSGIVVSSGRAANVTAGLHNWRAERSGENRIYEAGDLVYTILEPHTSCSTQWTMARENDTARVCRWSRLLKRVSRRR